MRRKSRWLFGCKSERGAALVEMALVVPFLMMIMCATIDFGLCMYTLNNLTAAVREGGRFAATRNPAVTANDQAVRDKVRSYIVGMNGMTNAQIDSTITNTAPNAAGDITVRITGFPYRPMTPLAPLLGLSTIPLNRTAIFRWELAPG
jgi:Flp pilus assembly protein TadG